MKRLILFSTILGLISLTTYGANYPVQPANNWIAKRVINRIFTDPGLAKHTTLEARIEAANAANELSKLIVKAVKETWVAKDGYISNSDVKKLNTYMYNHYHNLVVKYHWDDEKKVIKLPNWKKKRIKIETGLHKVINNGWTAIWKIPVKKWYKKANRVVDWIFHLGLYPTVNQRRILNEDGNKNVRRRLISKALNMLLKDDFNLHSKKKHRKHKKHHNKKKHKKHKRK